MPYDLQGPDLEVHLPGLRQVPDMFDRQAVASRRCREYSEDAYGAMDGSGGPLFDLSNLGAGVINDLAGTHARIRGEVVEYFDLVWKFATGQGEKVQESVELYETTDMEIARMMDSSLFLPGRRQEVQELGRSAELDPGREMAVGMEPNDPVDALKPLTDYRSEIPFEPEWIGTGRARDTIWQVTYLAHRLGLIERPVDLAAELLVPFTGDWARLKSCGDALESLANAASDLHTNVGWIELRIDAVWQGNVADACWLHTRKLQQSLSQAPSVLAGYASAYEEVVARVVELERQAAEVLAEALDWAIAAAFGGPGTAVKLVGLFLPPVTDRNDERVVPILEAVRLVFVLIDLVKLAVSAVWDFNARVELGLLHGPGAAATLPPVPAPSTGYT